MKLTISILITILGLSLATWAFNWLCEVPFSKLGWFSVYEYAWDICIVQYRTLKRIDYASFFLNSILITTLQALFTLLTYETLPKKEKE